MDEIDLNGMDKLQVISQTRVTNGIMAKASKERIEPLPRHRGTGRVSLRRNRTVPFSLDV